MDRRLAEAPSESIVAVPRKEAQKMIKPMLKPEDGDTTPNTEVKEEQALLHPDI